MRCWPAEPIFEALGKRIIHIGPTGCGQIAKACNQIMVAAQMVAMGELLVMAQKAGADPEKVIEAIKGGAAQCWTLDNKPQRLFEGNRTPGFKASMQYKDLNIVMDMAQSLSGPPARHRRQHAVVQRDDRGWAGRSRQLGGDRRARTAGAHGAEHSRIIFLLHAPRRSGSAASALQCRCMACECAVSQGRHWGCRACGLCQMNIRQRQKGRTHVIGRKGCRCHRRSARHRDAALRSNWGSAARKSSSTIRPTPTPPMKWCS